MPAESAASVRLRIVAMGVSGCGKSVIGAGVAREMGLAFRDGDDLHPQSNIDKMTEGHPLNDGDRRPWLDAVARALEPGMVIACSALKRGYRDRLRAGAAGQVTFLYLAGTRTVIAPRMASRKGHFMPTALLDSQFAALEPPGPGERVVRVDIDAPIAVVITRAVRGLRKMNGRRA